MISDLAWNSSWVKLFFKHEKPGPMMGHYCLWYFKTLVSVTTRALKKYIESIISKKPEKQKTGLKKKFNKTNKKIGDLRNGNTCKKRKQLNQLKQL